jgi:protoheme IX farnesyltransferase
MIVAQRGWPPLWLVVATVAGGSLAAGGANAINCYVDRDIDELMRRTEHRPLPEGRIAPRGALIFGLALEVLAFVELWAFVNLLAALLAASATVFYVGVYTLWLKRTSTHNIVVGGAAGGVPVLVGWAAVTGRVGAPAWVMFAIIFLWTPPHFWALAVKYQDDYRNAGVPMLPAVAGIVPTVRRILFYSTALVGVTFLLEPFGKLGLVYLLSAAVLGFTFMTRALNLYRARTVAASMRLFQFSIAYLGLLFVSMAVARLVTPS